MCGKLHDTHLATKGLGTSPISPEELQKAVADGGIIKFFLDIQISLAKAIVKLGTFS